MMVVVYLIQFFLLIYINFNFDLLSELAKMALIFNIVDKHEHLNVDVDVGSSIMSYSILYTTFAQHLLLTLERGRKDCKSIILS